MDVSEHQFKFTMDIDEDFAVYHKELQAKGHQATIKFEYYETQKQDNPNYTRTKHEMARVCGRIDRANGTYEEVAVRNEGRTYKWNEH